MVEMINARKRLGEIHPDMIHKILVLYVDKTDVKQKGVVVDEKLTKEMQVKAKLAQQVCKKYIEVLSRGKLTLAFKSVNLNASFTELTFFTSKGASGKSIRTVHGDIESIRPYPRKIILENYNNYDSFLFYWAGESLRKGKMGRATGMGGEASLPLIPYILHGRERGRLVISSVLSDRPGTLLHEVFHTFEKCYNIKPIHGFRKNIRRNFPKWKGSGEYDYYQFHFDNTFSKNGFKNLEYIQSNPNFIKSDFLQELSDKTKHISIKNLKIADSLFHKAEALYSHNNKKEAKNIFNELLQCNPYHSRALHKLCIIAHQDGDKKKAFEYIVRAYEISPYNPYINYWMGIEYYHKGKLKKAVEYLSKSIDYEPKNATSLQYRGFVNYKLGKFNDSMDDYKRCMLITDRFNSSITQFLLSRAKQGEKEAEKILKELSL